ncbi:hypothetical protein L873DRAFT_380561 [Choiromyces venosus 120613-1]|uniref:Uncharacterized protein n=1 Tax=Choiromyces venosus 120613-1 TaxID=1336337 RepID=A0A3N4IY51_9PEZI|nr:hypothetical protein L873DRAFT_380561 [Choiromyces venosus 120613-1]
MKTRSTPLILRPRPLVVIDNVAIHESDSIVRYHTVGDCDDFLRLSLLGRIAYGNLWRTVAMAAMFPLAFLPQKFKQHSCHGVTQDSVPKTRRLLIIANSPVIYLYPSSSPQASRIFSLAYKCLLCYAVLCCTVSLYGTLR